MKFNTKKFFKGIAIGLTLFFLVHLILVLCDWFIQLEFPLDLLVDDWEKYRFGLTVWFFVVCIFSFVFSLPESEISSSVSVMERPIERVVIEKNHRCKSTSPVDIALGVGAGIIGAEIITGIFEND